MSSCRRVEDIQHCLWAVDDPGFARRILVPLLKCSLERCCQRPQSCDHYASASLRVVSTATTLRRHALLFQRPGLRFRIGFSEKAHVGSPDDQRATQGKEEVKRASTRLTPFVPTLHQPTLGPALHSNPRGSPLPMQLSVRPGRFRVRRKPLGRVLRVRKGSAVRLTTARVQGNRLCSRS